MRSGGGGVRPAALSAVGLAVMLVSLLTPGFGQVALDTESHKDFLSALTTPDLGALTAGPSSPTGRGRPPRVGPNRIVNAPQVGLPAGLLGRSETTIAGTDDGRYLVAGWNDAQGFCGPPFGAPCPPPSLPGLSGYGYSSDGGLTWTDGGAPPVLNNVLTRGDPWLDVGGFDGMTFYYANLAVDFTTAASLGISVHRGNFFGTSFLWSDIRTFNSPNPNDFYDKEALAAAKDGSGRAYVSLTNFIEVCGEPAFGFGQIEVWRTPDAGDTWAGPTVVSPDVTFITDPTDLDCGETGVLQQSSAPAVGPNGEVYVVWQYGPTFNPDLSTDAEIRFARSLDGGATFDAPVTVAGINSMRANPPVGYNRDRINDHPRVAVATTGRFKGRVYVTYYSAVVPVGSAPTAPCPSPPLPAGLTCRDQTLTSSQVFIKYSDDQGLTWSSAVPVAPGPPATGLKRFWPVVSVEPGGNVDVVYYESQEGPVDASPFCTINVGGTLRRRGSANSLVDPFWAQSTNGGAIFRTPLRVSTATTNWCTTVSNIRPNFGDYIGSFSGGNRTPALWADGRNGVPDVFFAHILGAGRSSR